MVVLVLHLLSVAYLTGLVWLVQLVVYPSFARVGPTPAWSGFHAAHSSGITLAVGPPWALQGVTTLLLLLRRPDGVPLWLVLLAAALAAATVAVTLLVSVPAHERLVPYDVAAAHRLLSTNWLRTAAWTGGSVCAVAMLLTGG